MARYKVVTQEDPVLRKTSSVVSEVNDHIKKIMSNMAETMYHYKGVGLAAPQVGINRRIIVVDVGDELYKLANPEILSSQGIQDGPEGCLSVPKTYGNVKRSNYIKVSGLDENNNAVVIEAKGFKARAFQHEIDHLNGILFTDKATEIEKEI